MKKYVSFLLALMMVLAVMSPVALAAAATEEITPIVYVRGNGEKIFNAEGKEVIADVGDITLDTDGDGETTKDKIVEAVANILIPFLAEGLLIDKWDNYAKAIYEEISPLFKEAIMDKNGDPQYGTHVNPKTLAESEARASKNIHNADGTYSYYTYGFVCDWRLDPYVNADALDKYITKVLASTGKKQVSLTARCLGGSIINAYLERYGYKGHIKNVMYCDVLSEGCAVISKGFSGQIDFDSKSIQRYEGQLTYCDKIGYGIGFSVPVLADEIIVRTLDLFTQVGAVDSLAESIEALYARLYKALIPALFHSLGCASQPIYWTFVEEEDFDLALDVMFGEEGSETRKEFAGLIDRITYYRDHVTSQRDKLYAKFSAKKEDGGYGMHIGVIAKYGLLNPPAVKGYNELSDGLVSLKDSSFGATCAEVGSKLTDDYISKRIAEGYGDYISTDKQVDTSTCTFPETTWIVKNVQHDDFDRTGKALAEKFLNGTDVTVENSGFARFRVNDYETLTVETMTEENCGDLEFISRPEEKPTTSTILASLMRFLTSIMNFFRNLFSGKISF